MGPHLQVPIYAAKQAGEYLERFHTIQTHPPFSNGTDTWNSFIISWKTLELAKIINLEIITKEEAVTIDTYFDSYREVLSKRPIRFLHGDLQFEHVLVDPSSDSITGFLDFADAQPGDPLLDIAILTLWDNALAPLVIEGYSTIQYDKETQDIISLYQTLRLLAEIPWLLTRGFQEKAQKDIGRIKDILKTLSY